MGFKTQKVENVPQWATTYLMYNDDSALNDKDKKLVDDFEDKLLKKNLRLVCPIEGTESEFEPYPAFGLACDTVDWTAEVLPKTFKVKVLRTMCCDIYMDAHSKAEACREAIKVAMSRDRDWTVKTTAVAREKAGDNEEVAS